MEPVVAVTSDIDGIATVVVSVVEDSGIMTTYEETCTAGVGVEPKGKAGNAVVIVVLGPSTTTVYRDMEIVEAVVRGTTVVKAEELIGISTVTRGTPRVVGDEAGTTVVKVVLDIGTSTVNEDAEVAGITVV